MKAMKKTVLFFAVLMGALCLASCHKPEGDDLDDLYYEGDSTLFFFNAQGNVDYADFTVWTKPLYQKIQVDQLELHWLEKPLDTVTPQPPTPNDTVTPGGSVEPDPGDTTGGKAAGKDQVHVLIEKTTVLEGDWEASYQAFDLKPATTYQYFLVVNDLFGAHWSDTLEFTTRPSLDTLSMPSVTTDSAKLVNSQPCFYGSVKTHWRALDATKGFVLGIRYGLTNDALDQNLTNFVIDLPASGTITQPTDGDSVLCVFHCAAPLLDSCWYQAYVEDSWGNEFVSDTMLQYSTAAPRAVWVGDGVYIGGATQVTFRGNSDYKGGEDLSMIKRGFCWAKHPNPTLADSVWCDPAQPLEWLKKYEYHLTGLQADTRYYGKVFLMLNDPDSTLIWSEEKTFKTNLPVGVTIDEPTNITSNSMDLSATMGLTAYGVEECGFIWRERPNENDNNPVTFGNLQNSTLATRDTVGLNLRFTATATDLKPKQQYVMAAYVKFTNGETSLSASIRPSTE